MLVSYKDVRTFFQIPVLVLQRFEGGMLLGLGSVLFRIAGKRGEQLRENKMLSLWILFLSHYVKVPACESSCIMIFE